jgi:6-pyruvoyltetrahydropterin/6-carboxytetrahydropterin synthase
MAKWLIDKAFNFCYGHRVWTQVLNSEFSLDSQCACRHLHGHEGYLRVFLEGDKLENTGMVTDFKHLGWLKKFIDDNVDHQFIIDVNDPGYLKIIGGQNYPKLPIYITNTEYLAGYKFDLSGLDPNSYEYELLEGFFIVDFPPTSEKLSEWIHGCIQAKMDRLNVKVGKIEWFETPKSRAAYISE